MSSAMAVPLSQPETGTERPEEPGCTGPGGEAKVEAEGRDTGRHLPSLRAVLRCGLGHPGGEDLEPNSRDTVTNHPRTRSS